MESKPDEEATSPTATTPTKVFTQPSVASALYQDTGLQSEDIKGSFGGEQMSGLPDIWRVESLSSDTCGHRDEFLKGVIP